jgi:hypothetical protein
VNPSTRPQDLCLTQRFYKKSIDANYQVRVILPEKVVTHRNVDIIFESRPTQKRSLCMIWSL